MPTQNPVPLDSMELTPRKLWVKLQPKTNLGSVHVYLDISPILSSGAYSQESVDPILPIEANLGDMHVSSLINPILANGTYSQESVDMNELLRGVHIYSDITPILVNGAYS